MIDPEIVHSLKASRGRRMADDWEKGEQVQGSERS